MPLVGPSSLLLALAASGLNGQSFCFHGYLPVEAAARTARHARASRRGRGADGGTQMFIEAPYRNNQLLAALLETCDPQTRLCLATDLTLPSESHPHSIDRGMARRYRPTSTGVRRSF